MSKKRAHVTHVSKKRQSSKVRRQKSVSRVSRPQKSGASTRSRIQTWIPNFDKLIGGGYVKNSINLLIGGSGTGKSIFAVQFLVEAIERGERCLYVTFEEKKEQFYQNMLSLGWDLEEYEKKGTFTFLEYTPVKVRTMLEEGGGAIESTILEKKISRIVIDSISSFALLFQDESTQREAALSLFSMIRDWNCTSLLTLEEDALHRQSTTTRSLEFEVDSTVAIYLIRGVKQRQRYIEILKMRGTNHSNQIYPLDIKKKGFFVKTKPVSHLF